MKEESKENDNISIQKEKDTSKKDILDLNKKKKNRTRMILVLLFLLLFAGISYIELRGSYLEYLELGQNYTNIFYTNLTYRYGIMAVNFVILYFILYFTNRGIKKGLKPFFEKEKKEIPKLPNKSLALVISALVSFVTSSALMQKIMLIANGTSFGIQDPIFGLDIAYYMFQKPVIETLALYFVILFVGLSIYIALYYVIAFNRYFDGVDGKMLKESLFMKKLTRNALLIIIGIAILTVINTQNTMFGKILTVKNDLEIVGAGMTETTIKLWGYVIFAFVIIIFAYRALKYFKKGNTGKVLKNLAVIPGYLVVLFIVMVVFDLAFVSTNELDKEKEYIAENIKNTKNAYNINIEEKNIENSGTITSEEVEENANVINNIPVISKDAVSKTLENSQTVTGHYVYPNISIAKYNINGKNQLVYVAPREITNSGRTYNNKTYEYTHGIGEIFTSATESSQNGNIQYIQKDIVGKDEKINISEPRIYFGLETKETIATNTKNKNEYDYTDENGTDQVYSYNGQAGLQLGFLDRLILGMKKGDINLAFSGEITNESKILINRDVITRAKKALPYLIYDEEPYTAVTDEGKIVWVLDAYTVSSSYPYSQYTSIEHDGTKEKINYIRNSVKVIIDSYDGTMSYYITDRNDPIAMAYRNIYPSLFKELDEKIPEDISSHFVYPEFLYNVQAKILKVYHNVKPDVLYRTDDVWSLAKYNATNVTKSTGTELKPYYTMVKTLDSDENRLGLVLPFTPYEKQNIISYMVGTYDGGTPKITIYKFESDSNILGPMQLDTQIEQDEQISKELEALNVTGTRITKNMVIVPLDNTLLYVEPVYQQYINEEDSTPTLKKVIVASGNKLAIGDNLNEALRNLVSQYAVDIEVENTDSIEDLVNAVIKANNNLKTSTTNSNYEMMGKDIQRLQDLINQLENVVEEERKEENKIKTNDIDANELTDGNAIGNLAV